YLGIQTSASLVSWIMLVFLLLANVRLPLSNLLVLALPVAILGVLSLITAPLEDGLHVATLTDPLIWHILISIVAYSVLFMAACQSVLLAVVERRLKSKRTRLLHLLPPLQTMETLLFDLLWAGIAVLTLAIGSGFVFLDDMFEQRVVHHTVLTLASWFLYAALLAGHHVLGWRGTTAVRWTLIAFGLLVLGYFGSKFVIEILLES
ncbi:MAG TPA: cytochrome c biogenesis protein CcsA, partial [Pseudomonadales bacterium]